MHKALLLKYPDSGIPSFFTFVKEYSIYLASVILGGAARSPLRKEKLILRNNVTGVDVFGANDHYSSGKVGNIALVNIDIAIQIFICNFFDFIFVIIYPGTRILAGGAARLQGSEGGEKRVTLLYILYYCCLKHALPDRCTVCLDLRCTAFLLCRISS